MHSYRPTAIVFPESHPLDDIVVLIGKYVLTFSTVDSVESFSSALLCCSCNQWALNICGFVNCSFSFKYPKDPKDAAGSRFVITAESVPWTGRRNAIRYFVLEILYL